jgi:hypothetical protein
VATFMGAHCPPDAPRLSSATDEIGRETHCTPGSEPARAAATLEAYPMRKMFVLVLLILSVPTVLMAQDDWRNRGRRDDPYRRSWDNAFELTPFVGYTYGGRLFADQTGLAENVRAESSANFGGDFAIPIGYEGFKIELMANHQSTRLVAGSGLFSPSDRVADFDVTYYHAGLVIPFAQSRSATPYVVVSAGVANLDPKISGATAENRFSASGGLGVKIPFNRSAGIRLEARGFYTTLPNDNGCSRCYYNYTYRDFYQGQTNAGVYFRF